MKDPLCIYGIPLFQFSFIFQQTPEDGMCFEYTVHFVPNIIASIADLEFISTKFTTKIRRLSTPSYAEGEWEDNSFKTQWRWFFEDDFGSYFPFDSVSIISEALSFMSKNSFVL